MLKHPTYDDKMAFVTDYLCKLPKIEQVEIMEKTPASWTLKKQVNFLYEEIKTIVERRNPGLRPDKPESFVPDALGPKKQMEESD
jgi:predicted DNA-binding protein (UPF0278 family)|tara:strand:+ start:730 stop:984 length:255 start_codon:yes stop_codon:yes gene_type:complete